MCVAESLARVYVGSWRRGADGAKRRGYFTRTAGPVTSPAYRTRYTPAPGTATA